MNKPYIPSDDDFNDSPFSKYGMESSVSDISNFDNHDWKSYYAKSDIKPPLNFELEGKPVTIYGGSCHHPMIDDADIYVSLDVEPPVYYWEQPWYEDEGKKHIRFAIPDMSIPEDTEDFKSCIEHIKYSISEGKKVHVGCIGGHGRTGMVLSALIQESMGDKLIDQAGNKISAIDYVREHYAKKSVETVPQILFLHYNFGIALPKGSSKEVSKFLDCFEREIGVPLDDIIQKGASFDEVADVLKEVDNIMFSQLQFAKRQLGKTDFLNPPHIAKTDNGSKITNTNNISNTSTSNPTKPKF